jgi:hypothetical protein
MKTAGSVPERLSKRWMVSPAGSKKTSPEPSWHAKLVTAYYALHPDPAEAAQREDAVDGLGAGVGLPGRAYEYVPTLQYRDQRSRDRRRPAGRAARWRRGQVVLAVKVA